MNLFLLCEYPTLSGGERSMLATLDGVRTAGFEVVLVGPPEGPLAEAALAQHVEIVPLATSDAHGTRLPQPEIRKRLRSILARRQVDLVHANSLSMGRLSGPVVAELHLPSIAHLRDIVRLSARAKADLNRHTRLLAVSEATRAYHVAAGLSAEKTQVVHNGVDLATYRPRAKSGDLHRELNLPTSIDLVGTIGQIGLRKGHDVLLHAAARLAERLPHVHYVIVGARWSEKTESRQFEADLRAKAGGPLAGHVHFLGYRDDVPRILNELTLLTHPARQEPLGRVLLEAAASGLAVVATDVGGTREIFPPEFEAARLVKSDDAGGLAASIAELILDRALRDRMAASSRRRAEQAFGIERATACLLDHYRQVLSTLA